MKEILELSNYVVHTASNGKQGLEFVQKIVPDAILCAIVMLANGMDEKGF